MKKEFWFDYVDLKALERYIRKYIIGNPYDMVRVKDKDLIKISYEMRNDDYRYTEYLTPFGLATSPTLVDGYNYGATNPASKELFNIMYQATKGRLVDGKTYPEAYKEEHESSIARVGQSKSEKLNKKRDAIGAEINKIKEECLAEIGELNAYVTPIIAEAKTQKSLIIVDILRGMSREEQQTVLAQLGYIPAAKEIKKESTNVSDNSRNI